MRAARQDPLALVQADGSVRTRLLRKCTQPVERLLGLTALAEVYERAQAERDADFIGASLRCLGVSVEADGLDAVPAAGRLLVVANHPFGGIEGLALLHLLYQKRPDRKFLANYLLGRLPQMREHCIMVDPFGGANAGRANVGPLREALRWLAEDHVLGVFPAGEVAHWTPREGQISDPPWSATTGRLVLRASTPVLPVFIEGRNSLGFHVLGCIAPQLRTALLPRELLNKRGTTIHVTFGRVIPFERLSRLGDADEVTRYLRVRTFAMQGRSARGRVRLPIGPQAPVAERPESADRLAAEIAALRPEYTLAESGASVVLCAPAAAMPVALREIGRLRELTFREVGEGTGKPVDLDRFDAHYHHLFVWNCERQRIVGAYRLGLIDELLRQHGPRGLYTSTLFRFKPGFLEQLTAAIELGRSFVVTEFQRDFAPLTLLWKGIAQFLVRNDHYRALLGAVSISDRYDSLTKRLLMVFLEMNCRNEQLAELVVPRRPYKVGQRIEKRVRELSLVVRNLDDVNEIVADIEGVGQGVPVLVRQYLKLNSRVLAFNLDPDFGNVLDALMFADLLAVDPRILQRFFGREQAAAFLARHAPRGAAPHHAERSKSPV